MTVDKDRYERSRDGSAAEDPDDIRRELTELLGLAQIARTVVGAEIFGRGPSASVDLYLSGDAKVTFERFGEISKPAALTAHLMASVGVAKVFKAPNAATIGALIYRLARHHGTESADDAAREWGSEFLRLAAIGEVDLNDQAERWRGFVNLEHRNPAHDAGDDRSSYALASASVVLVDTDTGVRIVRAGWFLAYVRREVGGMYSPMTLGTQMERVGWQRRGGEGRVKATCPQDSRRTLQWRFYTVEKGWEG